MEIRHLIILIFLPALSFGQGPTGKYINDRFNENNYFIFNSDSTFKYRLSYHIIHDISCGKYKLINDTIFLDYLSDMRDTTCNKEMDPFFNYSSDAKYLRPAKLFYMNGKLYEFQDGKIKKTIETDKKQPKSSGYRRKYFLHGPYIKKDAYYMITESRIKRKKTRN